jgi:hypothetical protein
MSVDQQHVCFPHSLSKTSRLSKLCDKEWEKLQEIGKWPIKLR